MMIENQQRHFALTDIPEPFGKPTKIVTGDQDQDFFLLLLMVMFFFNEENFSFDDQFFNQLLEIFNQS